MLHWGCVGGNQLILFWLISQLLRPKIFRRSPLILIRPNGKLMKQSKVGEFHYNTSTRGFQLDINIFSMILLCICSNSRPPLISEESYRNIRNVQCEAFEPSCSTLVYVHQLAYWNPLVWKKNNVILLSSILWFSFSTGICHGQYQALPYF